MQEYQNIKILLKKVKSFVTKNVKNTVPWTYAFSDLNDEENVETF